jgi:hypothetical protein
MPSSGGDRPQGPTNDHRDKVRILVVGPTNAVNRVILEMSHLGFSDAIEWSKPIPTDRRHEAMRVLTRYVFAGADPAASTSVQPPLPAEDNR